MNTSIIDIAHDLRKLADHIQILAETIESSDADQPQTPATAEEKKPDRKEVSFEEVRAECTEKSDAGFTAEVRALIKKYGSTRLSKIDPKKYADLLAEVKRLK